MRQHQAAADAPEQKHVAMRPEHACAFALHPISGRGLKRQGARFAGVDAGVKTGVDTLVTWLDSAAADARGARKRDGP